jgi:methylisocitrate lyase
MPSLSSITPPGARFRRLVDERQPLQVVGAINAYCALLAEKAGHEALYLSGAGVANASFGLPDLGMTQLSDVAEDAQRITSVSDLPLLVDIDTGFGGALNIARTRGDERSHQSIGRRPPRCKLRDHGAHRCLCQ